MDEQPWLFDKEELRIKDAGDPAPEPPSLRAVMSQWAEAAEVELIFFDPPRHFDHAIVGLVTGFGQAAAVLYDADKVLAAMVADGMTQEEAEEWFEFNTIGAFVGEATPRFVTRPWEEEKPHVEET